MEGGREVQGEGSMPRLWDLGTLLQEGGWVVPYHPWLQVLCGEQRCFRRRCCFFQHMETMMEKGQRPQTSEATGKS